MAAAFLVGIDLGTTNTVVAFARAHDGGEPEIFPLPQLVTATEAASRAMLPSALYAPLEGERARDPWGDAPWVGGEYARRRGAEVPGRQVASAKSWLAHGAVDRRAAVLPWGSESGSGSGGEGGAEGPRISPVEANARYLEHVRRAWDAEHPDDPLAEQEVVLTVPASFDETARELTLEAANSVGLAPRLLEEPTAAFYDWMRRAGEARVASLVDGAAGEALVLVCDVGGGTTDLSLIRVARADAPSGIEVSRVAVGRHLLLGGDNMDLALAHACEGRMAINSSSRLDLGRFGQLVAACRDAKERLLTADGPDEVTVAVAGSGSRLVGSTLSTKIARTEAESIVLEGFFPRAARDAEPTRTRSGLVAFGLPYERDVAVTRHVASFFARHGGDAVAPRALLLNGGVFRAERIAARLVEAIDGWGGPPLHRLPDADPDLAVARGAVAYALARHGKGVRIGGGSPRGYYVEVAGDGPRTAVCVVPRGAREGAMQVARSRPLSLSVGKPGRFELWASDEATGHAPGDIVVLDDDRFTRLPPIATTFPRGASGAGETVRVALEGELTEIGTLDLACVELEGQSGAAPRRFRLAFALRESAGRSAPPPSVAPSRAGGGRALDAAVDAVARVYGKGRPDATPRDVKDLVRDLERHLGERSTWDTATARALFDVLALASARGARRRSPDHERVFWQLAGFCLRPGFGDADGMDPARVATIAPLGPERLAFPDQARGWQQFFIAWRRIAAGMQDGSQVALRDLADPWLAPTDGRAKKHKGAKPLADPEMLEMAASLERVPASRRAELGGWILERTWTDRDPRLLAAIGRVGARVPAYASLDHVVPPHAVEGWVDHLLRAKWEKPQLSTAAEALVRLARVTGDRGRDLSEGVRKNVARRLESVGATEGQISAVSELVVIEEEERATFWGESLPVGLRLAGDSA
ncbi:MAG: Hsp70 family protein [Polyangiaceae bacterium]